MPARSDIYAVRVLGPGDDAVVAALATYDGPRDRTALLADERTLFVAAFDGDEPIGFVLAHDLPRRHGDLRQLFVYEVDVAPAYRRRGVARALLDRLAEEARRRGIDRGFVLTEPGNGPANALYRAAGGTVEGTDVVWEFRYR
jgi:aminoglycoside 6'-N-acetyltransferase I